MPIAHLQWLATGLAETSFVGDSHAAIERSIDPGGSVPIQIVESSVTNFEYTLFDYVLFGTIKQLG